MLIQRDAGDGIDENAEFDIVLDLVEKRRIERMNALDQQD